jgi:hypothetical protein
LLPPSSPTIELKASCSISRFLLTRYFKNNLEKIRKIIQNAFY